MNREVIYRALWFLGGAFLALDLSFGTDLPSHLPNMVAYGFLCFGCGVLLTLYMDLRIRLREADAKESERSAHWFKEMDELYLKKSEKEKELEKQRDELEAEKERFEDERDAWEEAHGE